MIWVHHTETNEQHMDIYTNFLWEVWVFQGYVGSCEILALRGVLELMLIFYWLVTI